jgi:hypothetical protein
MRALFVIFAIFVGSFAGNTHAADHPLRRSCCLGR